LPAGERELSVSTATRLLFIEDVPTEVALAVRQFTRHGVPCEWRRVESAAELRTVFETSSVMSRCSDNAFCESTPASAVSRRERSQGGVCRHQANASAAAAKTASSIALASYGAIGSAAGAALMFSGRPLHTPKVVPRQPS